MKLNKTKKKIQFNQGNSFIVVVATISFLAVLVTALLVAVALCYRLKAYDINSRDNFYFLEKAMDEIYEDVGSKTMQHLNAAYNETLEVLVYFDPAKETYVTMSDEDANIMMRKSFINRLQNHTFFTDRDQANDEMQALIDPTGDLNLTLTIDNITRDNVTGAVTFHDIVITRSATYSTINTSDVEVATAATNTYVQSITTDLVVSAPEYDVDFTNVGKDVDDLYDFVMISDMGVEITGIGTKSHITGNVYAAADFYNKEYNEADVTKVNSYDGDKLKDCDGVSERSMYSGFYVDGADVSIVADKLIVPGSIASMNCAELSIVGNATSTGAEYAQVWADGIVLGGYSRKLSSNADAYSGSVIDMKADTYVYDDLEINATGSEFALDGNYYGYNYASTDNRTYSDEFIAASTNRKYLAGVQIYDGNYVAEGESGALKSQAHYNSSAIIVNGADSLLDLSDTESIYVAGQAYVELSKTVKSNDYAVNDDDDDDTLNEAKGDTYSYTDAKNQTSYTTTNSKDADAIDSVQDYRTGEAISIKSNQLAYIPPYKVRETEDGEMYVEWPEILTGTEFETIFAEMSKVPVIKTVVSGKVNYFYDFTDATITINEYLEKYADLFNEIEGQPRSTGTMADFYDITDYRLFKVENVILDDTDPNNMNNLNEIQNKIYSNSAISYKNGDKINVIADSDAVDVLTTAATALTNMNNANVDPNYQSVTMGLNNEYKEMKMLLTSNSTDGAKVDAAHTTEESLISPINEYFDLSELPDLGLNENELYNVKMASGYKIFMKEGDVVVTDTYGGDLVDGKVKGIVVCTGDVTFDGVTEFEGIIVAGGKIKVDQSINFVANAEVVKSILRECYDSNNSVKLSDRTEATDWQAKVCRLFKNFAASYNTASGNTAETVDSMKSVTAVVYEDMLSFENWKKNVD